ncbi:MAG: glycerate kinase [Actinobacteria bacterium]|nr:MAG: glycerate kinase [Actinomycetota bacterium]
MSALASPASLKGVLSARDAAASLAEGFRSGGAEAKELPIADGGEGTAEVLGARVRVRVRVSDAFGRPREAPIRVLPDGTAVVEAAEAIPLDPQRLDPLAASSRGLGELIAKVEAGRLLVCLGGTANVDGGAGLREVLRELPASTTVLCDALVPLRDAALRFAPQKGATPEQIELLERRLSAMRELAPYAELPGAGAAGGLGAALAALGAELVPGAREVLARLRFRDRVREASLVVTGEGTVDATTTTGKAPGEALRICLDEGIRCVVFGGRVVVELAGAETVALSGDPARAADDLVALGERLSRQA